MYCGPLRLLACEISERWLISNRCDCWRVQDLTAAHVAGSSVIYPFNTFYANKQSHRLLGAGIPCKLVTGQEVREVEGAKHVAATVEMAPLTPPLNASRGTHAFEVGGLCVSCMYACLNTHTHRHKHMHTRRWAYSMRCR